MALCRSKNQEGLAMTSASKLLTILFVLLQMLVHKASQVHCPCLTKLKLESLLNILNVGDYSLSSNLRLVMSHYSNQLLPHEMIRLILMPEAALEVKALSPRLLLPAFSPPFSWKASMIHRPECIKSLSVPDVLPPRHCMFHVVFHP